MTRGARARFAGVCATMLTATAALGQSTPRAALLSIAFDGQHAVLIQPGDSAMATVATDAIESYLRDSAHVNLADSAAVTRTLMSSEVQDTAGGRLCTASYSCVRTVGRLLGASWVVTGMISKISNLVWAFRGQLTNATTGELVLNDEYELKGDSRNMVPRGAVSFARRVVKKISP